MTHACEVQTPSGHRRVILFSYLYVTVSNIDYQNYIEVLPVFLAQKTLNRADLLAFTILPSIIFIQA